MNINSKPQENLSIFDSAAIVVGIVIGVGIFKTPSIVASVSESPAMLILFWMLGGLISLIGALCYAELSSTHPHAGGDYHFLKKAFGQNLSFLFAWSRMTVVQSGSIAMVAYLFGDYATEIFSLGSQSSAIYALAAVAAFSAVNILGIKQGKRTQHVLISMIILGILAVAALSVSLIPPVKDLGLGNILPARAALGTAMIFVLLTYGGWNEAAFISAEVNSKKKNMIKVLLYSIAMITFVYLIINLALIRGLGLSAMAESKTVMADLLKKAVGPLGSQGITILILFAALSTINATIITGARTNYALGQDYPFFRFLGVWKEKKNTPINALIVQCAIAMALILFGAGSRDGFVMMIEYITPVFWFFLLAVVVSLFSLRRKYPHEQRPFSVPFYPITPIIFCFICGYMLYASIAYTGMGALVGIAVLLTGVPILLLQKNQNLNNLKTH